MTILFSMLQRNIREFRSFKTTFGWIAETPSKPEKFTVLRVWFLFARTSFYEKRFSAKFFEMQKFKKILLKLVGCLVDWPPVLTLYPNILGSIPKRLKKANKNFNILPGNQICYFTKKKIKRRKTVTQSRTSDEFNERSPTLQISTEVNNWSSGERKPAKINELRAQKRLCMFLQFFQKTLGFFKKSLFF
jgi:hypothetical protein